MKARPVELSSRPSWCASSPKDAVIAHHPHTMTIDLTGFLQNLPDSTDSSRAISHKPQDYQ
jgi:hypothetical protein